MSSPRFDSLRFDKVYALFLKCDCGAECYLDSTYFEERLSYSDEQILTNSLSRIKKETESLYKSRACGYCNEPFKKNEKNLEYLHIFFRMIHLNHQRERVFIDTLRKVYPFRAVYDELVAASPMPYKSYVNLKRGKYGLASCPELTQPGFIAGGMENKVYVDISSLPAYEKKLNPVGCSDDD